MRIRTAINKNEPTHNDVYNYILIISSVANIVVRKWIHRQNSKIMKNIVHPQRHITCTCRYVHYAENSEL